MGVKAIPSRWNASVTSLSDAGVIDGVAGAALDGMRLDRAVALVAEVSRSVAARLVSEGAVSVDGGVATSKARRIAARERLTVAVGVDSSGARPRADDTVEFTVVHDDDDVVVVDKPAGLVVHPGAGHGRGTLVNGLLARYPDMADVGERSRPGIVHRLDRHTSGLLVVARSLRAHESLTAQLRARRPRRVYTVLVWGAPEADVGVVEAPIGRSNRNPTRMAVTVQGRPAVTRYRVRHRFSMPTAGSLLSCRLETGRTHQIRVHLLAIGHPVVGDCVYSGSRDGDSYAVLGLQRPFLHAGHLDFRHPATGGTVGFDADLPDDLTAALSVCRVPFTVRTRARANPRSPWTRYPPA